MKKIFFVALIAFTASTLIAQKVTSKIGQGDCRTHIEAIWYAGNYKVLIVNKTNTLTSYTIQFPDGYAAISQVQLDGDKYYYLYTAPFIDGYVFVMPNNRAPATCDFGPVRCRVTKEKY